MVACAGRSTEVVLCSFAESATGIREGGRTGIVGLTVAFWMFIALWFTPIIGEHACLPFTGASWYRLRVECLPARLLSTRLQMTPH